MQSLVRESYQSLEKNLQRLPPAAGKEASLIAGKKEELLQTLRRIYHKKLDIWKIRIHGTYNLKKLLMTGRDIVIQDFGGNPLFSYSERRIKRSPVRDLAEMITSFHYSAYEGFFSNEQVSREELDSLLPFAEQWAHYMSGFFMKAYLDNVQDRPLLPRDPYEMEVVLNTFLLEKALGHFIYELRYRPEWVIAPLRIIKSILGITEEVRPPVKNTLSHSSLSE
jgi:maltose alpha-D-glucosyltransferase/alpha-amylase